MSDYTPRPLNTDGVELPEALQGLVELLARNAHETWAALRLEQGWRLGPQRDDALRLHPCLVAYEELPESEKAYDRALAVQVLKSVVLLGYRILPPGA